MTFEQWAANRKEHGQWPETIPGSIVTGLWERHCPTWPRGESTNPNIGKHIDEIDDPTLKRAIAAMERLKGWDQLDEPSEAQLPGWSLRRSSGAIMLY